MKELRTTSARQGGSSSSSRGPEAGSRASTNEGPVLHRGVSPSRQQQQHFQGQLAPGQDISQFDASRIIYDSSTDTNYLRGRLLGKVRENS